jgi:RCR-type E3 ubiquitin transferase
VKKKSLERAKFEGIDKHDRLKDPNDRYYNKLPEYSMFKLAYYQCYKCKTAYFGGLKDCQPNEAGA